MVKVSYEQKPFRREVMRTYGASITPSPSDTTKVGRKILEEFPGTTGIYRNKSIIFLTAKLFPHKRSDQTAEIASAAGTVNGRP